VGGKGATGVGVRTLVDLAMKIWHERLVREIDKEHFKK